MMRCSKFGLQGGDLCFQCADVLACFCLGVVEGGFGRSELGLRDGNLESQVLSRGVEELVVESAVR